MDSGLRHRRCNLLEFDRASIPQRGMPTAGIVEALNVGKDVFPRFGVSQVVPPVNQFDFECAKETFHGRIVVTVPATAHAGHALMGR